MTATIVEVIKPGLETTVQDYPGRVGVVSLGYPISGPMDSWSFRIANRLVGNEAGAAGLECQYIGPELRFHDDRVIAVCGAEIPIALDGAAIAGWTSVAVGAGQRLALGSARRGARAYVAISGGIAVSPFLGSRATYRLGQVGGIDGAALKAGQRLSLGVGVGTSGRRVGAGARPGFPEDRIWSVDVVPGPNDDWIDEPGQARFLSSDWTVSAHSNRVGLRLEGPEWTFARKAYEKSPENGTHPSNVIEHGYGLGSINLCGQTPIVLGPDGLTLGGFINPYTVPTGSLWKTGQARPGDIFRFTPVTVEEAQVARHALDTLCDSPEAIAGD
jgi:urea carboxylase